MRTFTTTSLLAILAALHGCDDRATHAKDGKPTAQDQSNAGSDLEITQAIRQAVVGDDSLSVSAENVKIITDGGVVTLRGPVKSAAEKATIERLARAVPGVVRVDSQIEVVP